MDGPNQLTVYLDVDGDDDAIEVIYVGTHEPWHRVLEVIREKLRTFGENWDISFSQVDDREESVLMCNCDVRWKFAKACAGEAVTLRCTPVTTSPPPLQVSEILVNGFKECAGCDTFKPLISWRLSGTGPERRQLGYEVRVWDSCSSYYHGQEGDMDRINLLWKHCRSQESSQQVQYSGASFKSCRKYCVAVRVTDECNNTSPWSETSTFSTGILKKREWEAEWIGRPMTLRKEAGGLPSPYWNRCLWVWMSTSTGAPNGKIVMRKLMTSRAAKIDTATVLITGDRLFKLWCNGKLAAQTPARLLDNDRAWDCPQRVDIKSMLEGDGQVNVFVIEAEAPTNSQGGVTGKLEIAYADRTVSTVLIDSTWRCHDGTVETVGDVFDVDYDMASWPMAVVLAHVGESVNPFDTSPLMWTVPGQAGNDLILPPLTTFRKTFNLDEVPASAVICASAMGLYAIFINKKRVGRDSLTPGWSQYPIRAFYNTYDVKDLLQEGTNVVEATLADGWAAGYQAFSHRRDQYDMDSVLRIQLTMTCNDGVTIVATGPDWLATEDGPFREGDIYMGDSYDARRESAPKEYYPPAVHSINNVIMTSYPSEPVRECEQVQVVTRHTGLLSPSTKNPCVVFDLGQNFAGWVRLAVPKLPTGTAITLRFAEVFDSAAGVIVTNNLRGARATDTYTSGGDEAVWEPLFTYHGFRFVELSAPSEDILKEICANAACVTGIVLHSDFKSASEFMCDKDLFNKIVNMVRWTGWANMLEVPTDCPQRDERFGYTGDGEAFCNVGCHLFDLKNFYTKFLKNITDSMDPNGMVGSFAPRFGDINAPWPDSPAWSDALVVISYTVYKYYNDKSTIYNAWAGLRRYMSRLETLYPTGIRRAEGDQPDDWLNVNDKIDPGMFGTIFYYRDCCMMVDMAKAIGQIDMATHFQALGEKVLSAFQGTFFDASGDLTPTKTQTAYAMTLYFDMVPEKHMNTVKTGFLRSLLYRSKHLSTGFTGTQFLLPALSKIGQDELAYEIMCNDTFPSLGYMVRCGATTVWERWDGFTKELGYYDPGMNSFCHYGLGAQISWLLETVGGIRVEVGKRHDATVAPKIFGDMQYGSHTYHHQKGPIRCEWQVMDVCLDDDTEVKETANADEAGILETSLGYVGSFVAGWTGSTPETKAEVVQQEAPQKTLTKIIRTSVSVPVNASVEVCVPGLALSRGGRSGCPVAPGSVDVFRSLPKSAINTLLTNSKNATTVLLNAGTYELFTTHVQKFAEQ